MNAKAVLILCATALLIQSAVGQYLDRLGLGCGECGGCGGRFGYGAGIADIGLASGLGAFCGGGLGVTSASAIPPVGLHVCSDNSYEGCVGVAGNLPFLGTAGVEGVFSTAGAGAINYGCGDGAVGITAQGGYGAGYGVGYGAGYEAGYSLGDGYGDYSLGGCGCGCRGGLY